MLLNNRGPTAPLSLTRLAWGFARALHHPHRRDQGQDGRRARCLPAVSGALCGGQDNLANELVKRPLVTRLASPRPIWEIPLKGCGGSCAAPSVAVRGAHSATLRPCIKIITRRDRWPSPPGASGPRGRCRGWGAAEGALPGPQRPSRPRPEPGGRGPRPPRLRGAAAARAPGGNAGPAASQGAAGAASTGPEARGRRGRLSVRLRPRQVRVSRRGGWAGGEEVPAVLLKRAAQPRRGAKPIAKNTYYTATFCK